MALVVKTNWKPQDTVTPTHFNRVEGNIGSLETSVDSLTTNKVDKVAGKALSSNDFTTAYINKISGLETTTGGLGTSKLDKTEFTAAKIGLLFNDGAELNASKLGGQIASYYAKASDVTSHIASKLNPHEVTKAQIGLGSVNNYGDATSAQVIAGTANKYVTASALLAAIGSMKSGDSAKLDNQLPSYYAVASTLTSHTGNTNNPHTVTKAQVGLGNVGNYANASAADIVAATGDRYATAVAVKGAMPSLKSGDSGKLNGQRADYYARATLSGTGEPPSTLAAGVIYIQY